MLVLRFHSDPGHGWLEVPKGEIPERVRNEITWASYQRGDSAFLEEDIDAGTLLTALKEDGVEYEINRLPQVNEDSFVRSLRAYRDS